ncbi:DTW domain-containing protein [Bordetella genomosp. 7]|nr:DTW domain-containing protein [Bordetella genomosp. 7]
MHTFQTARNLGAGRRPVCMRCQRPQAHCLCPLIPDLDSRTRVVVLQHPDEARHALNTARLAVLGLRNAGLHAGTEFDPGLWRIPGYEPCLLFPGETAQALTPGATPPDAAPRVLVVPDGTWRHARQLLARHASLAELPRVTLPPGLTSRYRVRHAGEPGALSTIEAIAAALQALESPRSYDALLKPFEALVAGQISAMGRARYERDHVRRAGPRALRGRQDTD